jgi:hypothetical protein
MPRPDPDTPRPDLPAPAIRVREVPAAAGLAWIRQGLHVVMRRPLGYLALFVVVFLSLIATLLLPPVLRLLVLALTPLLSLGFMIATEAVGNDLPVTPGMFLQPLAAGSAQRSALLRIGVVYVLTAAAVYLVSDSIDGGEANRWMLAMSTPKADGSPPEPLPLSGLGLFVLLLQMGWFALVSVPLWHAPALVHWGRQGAAHAMFSSVVAIWRTRAAFVLYQLGWCAIACVLGLVATVAAAAVGDARFGVAVMTPLMALLTIAFYASLWQGFVDTFEIRGQDRASASRGLC